MFKPPVPDDKSYSKLFMTSSLLKIINKITLYFGMFTISHKMHLVNLQQQKHTFITVFNNSVGNVGD